MRFFEAIFLVPGALAIVASRAPPVSQDKPVTVLFQLDKRTSEASVEIWDRDRSHLFCRSCSTSLDTGAFENTPISFNVDRNGAGNITIGSESYRVHEDPEISGGISCGRMHSKDEALVTCDIGVPEMVRGVLSPLNKRDLSSCFQKGQIDLRSILDGHAQHGVVHNPGIHETAHQDNSSKIEKRQRWCSVLRETRMVGDGNPHQNPLNIQLSDNMECGLRDCHITSFMSKSFTIGWSSSVSAFSWISGGFAVQESIETGNLYQCDGKPGDFFSVWKNQGQTAYTVQNWRFGCGNPLAVGGPYVMWSPNQQNRHGYYYCVYGRQYCRAQGDRWLDTNPNHPGGP